MSENQFDTSVGKMQAALISLRKIKVAEIKLLGAQIKNDKSGLIQLIELAFKLRGLTNPSNLMI